MASVRVTDAQLALLRHIAAGGVVHGTRNDNAWWCDLEPPHRQRIVTSRVAALVRAGWAVRGDDRVYQVTDEGRSILDRHAEEQNR